MTSEAVFEWNISLLKFCVIDINFSKQEVGLMIGGGAQENWSTNFVNIQKSACKS